MSTLAEIESAVEKLSVVQQVELLLFLAMRLRRERQKISAPRRFGPEQIGARIAEDERHLQRLPPRPCCYFSMAACCLKIDRSSLARSLWPTRYWRLIAVPLRIS